MIHNSVPPTEKCVNRIEQLSVKKSNLFEDK